MAKLLLITAVIFLSSNVLLSQKTSDFVDIEWGEELELYDSDNFGVDKIVLHNETGFYRVKWENRKSFIIDYIGNDMKLIKSSEIELKHEKEKVHFLWVLPFSGKLFLFSRYKDKKNNKMILYKQQIDLETMSLTGEISVVDEIQLTFKENIPVKFLGIVGERNRNVGTGNKNKADVKHLGNTQIPSAAETLFKLGFQFSKNYDATNAVDLESESTVNKIYNALGIHYFYFRESEDGSMFMIFHYTIDPSNNHLAIEFKLFNFDFEEISSNVIELPYEVGLCDIEFCKLGNDGNVYLVVKNLSEKRSKLKLKGELPSEMLLLKEILEGKITYNYSIFKYETNGDNLFEYKINSKGNFLSNLILTTTNDKQLICCGLYSRLAPDKVTGTYFSRINTEANTIEAEKFSKYGTKFIRKYTKNYDKKVKDISDVYLGSQFYNEDLIVRDSTIVFIAENFTTETFGLSNKTKRTVYSFRDILIMNFDLDGRLIWKEKIPKHFAVASMADNRASYFLEANGKSINLIYNGQEKNLRLKRNEYPKLSQFPSYIGILVNIDEKGNVKRMKLSSKDAKCRPELSYKISDSEYLFLGVSDWMSSFAKLQFKD